MSENKNILGEEELKGVAGGNSGKADLYDPEECRMLLPRCNNCCHYFEDFYQYGCNKTGRKMYIAPTSPPDGKG